MGTGPRIPLLDEFIESVIRRASEENSGSTPRADPQLQQACEALFRHYTLGD